VAGRVAYHHLVDKENRISVDPDMGRVLPLVAAALAAVASIHRRAEHDSSRTLTYSEVETILFRPGCDALVALDELFIRRKDLHRAIESLRMARQYFDGKP
jgi:hypothetical protein